MECSKYKSYCHNSFIVSRVLRCLFSGLCSSFVFLFPFSLCLFSCACWTLHDQIILNFYLYLLMPLRVRFQKFHNWVFELRSFGMVFRGVAFWKSKKSKSCLELCLLCLLWQLCQVSTMLHSVCPFENIWVSLVSVYSLKAVPISIWDACV